MNAPKSPTCALTDVVWVPTVEGLKTVRDTLIQAHTIGSERLKLDGQLTHGGLAEDLTAIQFGAVTRFLISVSALVVREGKQRRGFAAEDVDKAIARLKHASDVFHPTLPFMQYDHNDGDPLPADAFASPATAYLTVQPTKAQSFWDLAKKPDTMELPEAVLALVTLHFYSASNNSKLNGRGSTWSTPGFRWPGKQYTSTEFFWGGENLHQLIQNNLPKEWVKGTDLPGWADLACKTSRTANGYSEQPLWRATWSGNRSYCKWEGTTLVGISRGGAYLMPPSMDKLKGTKLVFDAAGNPVMKKGKKSHEQRVESFDGPKKWRDQRNDEDPHFLMLTPLKPSNSIDGLKAVRVDLGRLESDLVVSWNAETYGERLSSRKDTFVSQPGDDTPLIILQNLADGSVTGASIRQSEVLSSDQRKWAINDERADAVVSASKLILSINKMLTAPFNQRGRLGFMATRKSEVSESFWRNIGNIFNDHILNGESEAVSQQVWRDSLEVAMNAFDDVTSSASHANHAPHIFTARAAVRRNISVALGLIPAKTTTPKKKDQA